MMQQMTSPVVSLKIEQEFTFLCYQVVMKKVPEILKTSWGPAPLRAVCVSLRHFSKPQLQ